MRKFLFASAVAAALALTHAARAQSNPNWSYLSNPTAGQWNSLFSSKADVNGGTLTAPNVIGPLNLGSVQELAGIGVPNGVITAPPGSIYLRQDASASATLYVKEAGTGNTGWAAYAGLGASGQLTLAQIPFGTTSGTVADGGVLAATTTTANAAQSNATTALATANLASATAGNAQATANTAQTTAAGAASTANAVAGVASAAQAAATTATATATAAQTTANTAQSMASTAQTTAASAASTATAASTTANTAQSMANAAQTTATAAGTAASTAQETAAAAQTTANAAVPSTSIVWDGANLALYYAVPNGPRVCVVVSPTCPGLLPNSAAVLPANSISDAAGGHVFDPITGTYFSDD